MSLSKSKLCLFVLLATLSTSVHAISSGSDLYSMCKTVFLPKSEITQPNQIVGLGKCMGYVRGFAEASSLYEVILTTSETKDYSPGDLHPFVCGLAKISSNELAKEIVRYIDKKPSVIEEHPTIITISALGAKYPCSK